MNLLFLILLAVDGLAGGGPNSEPPKDVTTETATFAGGCFWCMQPPFDRLEGVVSTVVGYTGGKQENPTYEQVSGGKTGHTEGIQITFDPSKITYAKLLDTFWVNIDPTDSGGQFADRGSQYRPEIFYHSAEQRQIAEESKAKLEASGKYKGPIKVGINAVGTFYPAEEYHQSYYKKEAAHYSRYKVGSGRAAYVAEQSKNSEH